MKTVIRSSYTPKLEDYCNTLVIDRETGNQYLFDRDGVWTLISASNEGVIEEAVAQANAYTDDVAEGKVDKEEGKTLSENDFTDELKEKLDGIEDGAQQNTIEAVEVNGVAAPISDKTVDISVPTDTSDLTNGAGFITATQMSDAIAVEAGERESADTALQQQIDAIEAGSDVVDVVGTYAELQAYDTTVLQDNDIIKVLADETRGDAISYYRWISPSFSFVGSEGPYYTRSEADTTFVPKTRTINGKALSSNITLTASDVDALPSSTVIPTVNDATLTIQKNGSTVATFTSNSATSTTANIVVPTKTSDLTNDGEGGSSTYVETADLATVAFTGEYSDINNSPVVPTKTSELTNDSGFITSANIPTKTSDLTNDSGFITKNVSDLTNYYNETTIDDMFSALSIPTKTSDLTNDSGFITKSVSDLTNYYDSTTINSMFNALSIPTKTSDLTNDSGFITNTDYASAGNAGVIKVGTGLSIDASGVLSATGAASVAWSDISGKPTNVSYWTNDAGYVTSASVPTKTSDLTNDSGFVTSAAIPTATSDLTNDSGFITNSVNNLSNYYKKSETYTQNEVNSLISAIPVPTKTSDLTNDGADGTDTYVETDDLADFIEAEDIASTSALTPPVQTNMIADGAVTSAKIDWSTIVPEAITVSDYINFTVGSGSANGYKIGPIVVINFDRQNVNVVSGEKQIGTCTSKVKMSVYGAGRAASSGDAIPATFIAIPNGALRCHTTASRLNCAGTIWLLEA